MEDDLDLGLRNLARLGRLARGARSRGKLGGGAGWGLKLAGRPERELRAGGHGGWAAGKLLLGLGQGKR